MDLEGQLSNTTKPLKALLPQGSRGLGPALEVRSTRRIDHATAARSAQSDRVGRYSNTAQERTGDEPAEQVRATPPPQPSHPVQARLHAEDVEALVDGYRAGQTIMQLAGRFAISRTTVIAHLNRRNVERRVIARQWDASTLKAAARRYTQGGSLAQLGAEFGVDAKTIAKRLRAAGVPIRPRRGSK